MSESEKRFTGIPGEPSDYCLFLTGPFEEGDADAVDREMLETHSDGCSYCRAFLAGYLGEEGDMGDA